MFIKCILEFPWERQFQAAYTNSIFTFVQEQVKRTMYCHVMPQTEDDRASQDLNPNVHIEKIKVLERSIQHNTFLRKFTYTVEWRPRGEYINCNYRKFEFKGIFCCHIMKVLTQKNIQEVNERYLLRGYLHMTEEYKKYQIIEKQFQHCADFFFDTSPADLAMEGIDKMKFIEQQCNAMKSALLNWNPTTTTNNELIEGDPILDPNVTRTVGRPRESRYGYATETYGHGTNRCRPRPDEPVEGGECTHPVRRVCHCGPRGHDEPVARPNEPVEGGGRGLGESNAGPNEPIDESGRGNENESGCG
ncbi:hypothetical protein ACS0TY_034693 [Phlomoides rotata]